MQPQARLLLLLGVAAFFATAAEEPSLGSGEGSQLQVDGGLPAGVWEEEDVCQQANAGEERCDLSLRQLRGDRLLSHAKLHAGEATTQEEATAQKAEADQPGWGAWGNADWGNVDWANMDWSQFWPGGQDAASPSSPSSPSGATSPSSGPKFNYNWNFKCDDDSPAPAPAPSPGGGQVFNYNWNFCFEPEAGEPKKPPKKGNCASFGCTAAFDLQRKGNACQCFPGCESTAFGNICCSDYHSTCNRVTTTPVPVTRPGSYTEYENANCFAGHGALELPPSKRVSSTAECSSYCDADAGCEGFVMSNWNECWKRKDINIPRCAANDGIFSTFVKTSGTSRPLTGAMAYVKHAEKNCYSGRGAVEIGAVKTGKNTAFGCAAYCDSDPSCDCFVLAEFGHCFKRRSCQISQCVESGGVFDTYTKK